MLRFKNFKNTQTLCTLSQTFFDLDLFDGALREVYGMLTNVYRFKFKSNIVASLVATDLTARIPESPTGVWMGMKWTRATKLCMCINQGRMYINYPTDRTLSYMVSQSPYSLKFLHNKDLVLEVLPNDCH